MDFFYVWSFVLIYVLFVVVFELLWHDQENSLGKACIWPLIAFFSAIKATRSLMKEVREDFKNELQ